MFTDQIQPDRLIGVPEKTVTQIVSACHEQLEPPWQPDIVPVPLPEHGNSFVLVVRVDPARAPRPILIKGAAPIRLHGRNATADRARLAQLFNESPHLARRTSRSLPRPQLPVGEQGSPAADFIIRSGLLLPVDEAVAWRPLSERGVGALAEALNNSPVHDVLLDWSLDLVGPGGRRPFQPEGFNRARHAQLVWQTAINHDIPDAIKAIATAILPDIYGAPSSLLQFTLDIVARIRALAANDIDPAGPAAWRVDVPSLHTIIDGMLAALTNQNLVRAVADLAGIDPVVVLQPPSLDFLTGPAVNDLLNLDNLTLVHDAGTSHGANLIADPALDLRDTDERRLQIDSWLLQIGLDAGLRGMEPLLAGYHKTRQPT